MTQLYHSLHAKESKSGHYTDACTPMFTEELFTTGNAWDQARYRALSEHRKRWDAYILCSSVQPKKRMSMPFSGKQVVLGMNVLREISQNHKDKYYTFSYVYYLYTKYLAIYIYMYTYI